jgi:hypothetical protein
MLWSLRTDVAMLPGLLAAAGSADSNRARSAEQSQGRETRSGRRKLGQRRTYSSAYSSFTETLISNSPPSMGVSVWNAPVAGADMLRWNSGVEGDSSVIERI